MYNICYTSDITNIILIKDNNKNRVLIECTTKQDSGSMSYVVSTIENTWSAHSCCHSESFWEVLPVAIYNLIL